MIYAKNWHDLSRFYGGGNSPGFEELITWDRACQLSQEKATRGETTVSAETQPDCVSNDFDDLFRSNLPAVLKIIRNLSREDQEMLLSYHLLRKSQASLAKVYPHKTQTITSYQIRRASLTMGAYLLFGNPITSKAITPVLEKAGLEDNELETVYVEPTTQHVKTSVLIEAYSQCRNFQRVAEVYGIRKPEVRRTLSRVRKALLKSTDTKELALGAYVFNLIANFSNTRKHRERQGHMYMTDPLALGSFVLDVHDPAFEDRFTARANPQRDVKGPEESGGDQNLGWS